MRFVYGSKIHISKDKSKELSKYDALPGDILISRSGTVGEVCVVPGNLGEARISTNLMRIVLAPNGMLPNYFCLLFNGSPTILNQIEVLCKGSTRDFLNQKILSSIVFPLPSLAEQEQIVSLVEERMSIINELETSIEKGLKQAERQRQSILHKAFTGQLVPQDPNDEPASVLLERIQQERQREQQKTQKVPPKTVRSKRVPRVAKANPPIPDGPVEPLDVTGLTHSLPDRKSVLGQKGVSSS